MLNVSMPLLTTRQEYDAVREALQLFSQGQSIAMISQGDMQITYHANQMPQLQMREKELLRRLSITNSRKRTRPDFT